MISITIKTDNAAFEENKAAEIARILRELAKEVENDGNLFAMRVADSNDNIVCKYKDDAAL